MADHNTTLTRDPSDGEYRLVCSCGFSAHGEFEIMQYRKMVHKAPTSQAVPPAKGGFISGLPDNRHGH